MRANRSPRRHAAPESRRGIAAGALLLALVIVAGLLALAWSRANLHSAHRQLQIGCEAAALAGAAELVDEGVLYGELDPSDDMAAASAVARLLAEKNSAAGEPIRLAANPANDPRGDLVVGWIDDPGRWQSTMAVWDGSGPVNTLVVQASRTKLRGNPVALWAGRFVGLPAADVVSMARATVDQRVYGFRPLGGGKVPLVPLAASHEVWLDQAFTPATPGANDNFTVDYRAGAVSPGADGIPEIVLRLRGAGNEAEADDAPAGSLGALVLAPSLGSVSETQLERQLLEGLGADDLAELGGQFALASGQSGTLCTLAPLRLEWIELVAALQGANRVWPLGVIAQDQGQPCCRLVGFAAGVVVWAGLDTQGAGDEALVVVQPSLLVTSTALVRRGAGRNPWIGKVLLTQ